MWMGSAIAMEMELGDGAMAGEVTQDGMPGAMPGTGRRSVLPGPGASLPRLTSLPSVADRDRSSFLGNVRPEMNARVREARLQRIATAGRRTGETDVATRGRGGWSGSWGGGGGMKMPGGPPTVVMENQ